MTAFVEFCDNLFKCGTWILVTFFALFDNFFFQFLQVSQFAFPSFCKRSKIPSVPKFTLCHFRPIFGQKLAKNDVVRR